jgi:acyl dehydratase
MLPKVGDTASLTRSISMDEIGQFAKVSGDVNPVHVDEEFAKKTRFGGRIAHGMWTAALISAVLGTKLPGPGTIYLNQTLAFKGPVQPGEAITATVKVLKVREDKRIVTLETYCENEKGRRILEGEAVVLYEEVL